MIGHVLIALLSLRANLADALAKPDDWYDECVYWVNAVRAKEGLPALKRWKEKESCSDEMSAYDTTHGAHAAHNGGVGCTGVLAQNSCPIPDWPDDKKSIEECFIAMWQEKQYPGATKSSLTDKNDERFEITGHYRNLRGGFNYNDYDRVACGYHVADGKVYINTNFGRSDSGNDFQCGGDASTKPSAWLVDDCSERGNYCDCTESGTNYDVPGCEWTHECYYNTKATVCEDKSDAWFDQWLPGFDWAKCSINPTSKSCFLMSDVKTYCAKSCGTCQCDHIPSDDVAECGASDGGAEESSADAYNLPICVTEPFDDNTECHTLGDWYSPGKHNGKDYWRKVPKQNNPADADYYHAIWWTNGDAANDIPAGWVAGQYTDIWIHEDYWCNDVFQPEHPSKCASWGKTFGAATPVIVEGACACEDEGLDAMNGYCPSDASGCLNTNSDPHRWRYNSVCRKTCGTCVVAKASEEVSSKTSYTAQSIVADFEVYEEYGLNALALLGFASLITFAWKQFTKKPQYTDIKNEAEI